MMESEPRSEDLSDSCKELLMALDPNRALDQLECSICFHYVTSRNRPMIFCKNSTCVEKHTVCANCLRDMIQNKRKKDEEMAIPHEDLQQLPCPFCKQAGPLSYHQDRNKLKICQSLEVIQGKLKEVEINLKQTTQQQYEKKMKEIVDRAEIDIFKSKSEATRKNFLFERLKKRVQSSDKEMQKKLKDINEKAKMIEQTEERHRVQMQNMINENLQLRKSVEQKTAKIEELQEENQRLGEQLRHIAHIDTIETLVRHSPKRQSQNLIFNFGQTYREFKFRPMKDETFSQNFRETKPNYIIELKKERDIYLKAKAQLRQFHHRSFFSIKDQNDQLICFKVTGVNPTTRRYKFGLMDKNLKEIKRACLLLDLGENDGDRTESVIYFYINLGTKKLAGSMGQVKECWDIPAGAPLQKFTVYISFTDLQTQIKLE